MPRRIDDDPNWFIAEPRQVIDGTRKIALEPKWVGVEAPSLMADESRLAL